MINYEFEAEYQKLIDFNSAYYSKAIIKQLIAECVYELDKAWFRKLITRIILNPTQRIDIADAARSEKMARKSVSETKALLNFSDQIKSYSSENGLQNILDQYIFYLPSANHLQ